MVPYRAIPVSRGPVTTNISLVAIPGIRNFAHLAPHRLWRGEQPPPDEETAQALRAHGVQVILSLRDDGEQFGRVAGRDCGAYCIDDERALWEGRGFRFVHVRFTDFEAPDPAGVANAVRTLDQEVDAGRGVYVHCRAGIGRTGMLTCTWLMTRGTPGNEAAEIYLQFADDGYVRTAEAYRKEGQSPPTREEHAHRVGFRYQWWALHRVAEALGTPVTREFDVPEPPEPPSDSMDSENRYAEHLAPWRSG